MPADDISELSDEEQLALVRDTDNGPKSPEDEAKTAALPQDPGSVVE